MLKTYYIILDTIGRAWYTRSQRERERERERETCMDSHNFCICPPILKLEMTFFCDSQSLTILDNFQANPTIKNVMKLPTMKPHMVDMTISNIVINLETYH
jgi:hypothetical protein